MESRMAMVEMTNPHCQPLLSSTQTAKVTAMSAPQERQKT
uniref:Uncharacterized protein n=1 Tax=Arundo donax TaxID=35708 RepID=A0A0A9BGF9_ARUDO